MQIWMLYWKLVQECAGWWFFQLAKCRCWTDRFLENPNECFITWLFTFRSPLQPPLRNMESIFHGERAALAWAAGDTTLPMDFSIMGPSELREVSKKDQNAAWEQIFWNIILHSSPEWRIQQNRNILPNCTFSKYPMRKLYYFCLPCNVLGP